MLRVKRASLTLIRSIGERQVLVPFEQKTCVEVLDLTEESQCLAGLDLHQILLFALFWNVLFSFLKSWPPFSISSSIEYASIKMT